MMLLFLLGKMKCNNGEQEKKAGKENEQGR